MLGRLTRIIDDGSVMSHQEKLRILLDQHYNNSPYFWDMLPNQIMSFHMVSLHSTHFFHHPSPSSSLRMNPNLEGNLWRSESPTLSTVWGGPNVHWAHKTRGWYCVRKIKTTPSPSTCPSAGFIQDTFNISHKTFWRIYTKFTFRKHHRLSSITNWGKLELLQIRIKKGVHRKQLSAELSNFTAFFQYKSFASKYLNVKASNFYRYNYVHIKSSILPFVWQTLNFQKLFGKTCYRNNFPCLKYFKISRIFKIRL
jgi:hypothetical protein